MKRTVWILTMLVAPVLAGTAGCASTGRLGMAVHNEPGTPPDAVIKVRGVV